MKKIISLLLALVLVLAIAAASADPITVDGVSDRGITIHEAGLNEPIPGYSTTTGRKLSTIYKPEGFLGTAVSGIYQPIMVQIANTDNGVGKKQGKYYRHAPINASYADIVYEACNARGDETRTTMIFSDVVPDYVGWLRSTRLTHVYLREEWDCAFVTSGWSQADVPDGWTRTGIADPKKAYADNPGLVYPADLMKTHPWGPYVMRVDPFTGAHSEVADLIGLLNNVIPQDHVPANHTWLFTDELPASGDDASFIYVAHSKTDTDTWSRLEYYPEENIYRRIVFFDGKEFPYTEILLDVRKINKAGKNDSRMEASGTLALGDEITFSNIIVQSVDMHWIDSIRPDPILTGRGNADYFMGGKHIAGVWERKDGSSRTVFYDENGEEIKLQRGKTLIILMDYEDPGVSLGYE